MTEELLRKLGEHLQALHNQFMETRKSMAESMLGQELDVCNTCSKPMIPRDIWESTSVEVRRLFRELVGCTASKGRCRTCQANQYRTKGPLSPEELDRLRRDVGVVK